MATFEQVTGFLAHYASQYYDPAKAHEYYLRNRELKGLQPAAPAPTGKLTKAQRKQLAEQRKAQAITNQKQREAWGYASKQISGKRKADLTAAAAAQKARTEAMTKSAQATQSRIEAKLTAYLKDLQAKSAVKVEPVKLNVIPPDASPKVRAFLERQNASLKRDAQKKTAAASSAAQKSASAASAQAQKQAAAEVKRVRTELQAALTKARSSYTASRNQLVAKYKSVADTEHKNIKAQVR